MGRATQWLQDGRRDRIPVQVNSTPPPLANTSHRLISFTISNIFFQIPISAFSSSTNIHLQQGQKTTLVLKLQRQYYIFLFSLKYGGEPQKKYNRVKEERDAEVRKGRSRANIISIPFLFAPTLYFLHMSGQLQVHRGKLPCLPPGSYCTERSPVPETHFSVWIGNFRC